ncbi:MULTISPECIES: ribokinase [Actinomycetes]|uniref:Ribokinase n=2 Tax=Actinomycetes TaxID=1760 RepID=A0ABP6LRP9_9MICC
MGVVVVGSINVDLIVRARRHPAPGETVLGRDLEVRPGGKGANQAVAAAARGASVTFIGAVGSDEFAEPAQSGLRAAGVDLTGLVTVAAPTGLAVVTVDDGGENSIVVIPGANTELDRDAVAGHEARLSQAAVVVLQGEIPREGVEEAARLAQGRVVLNLAPAVEVSAATLRRADPLVVNEHEAVHAAALLAGSRGSTPGAAEAPVGGGLAAMRELVSDGVPSVVMTAGAAGAYLGRSLPGPGVEVTHVPAPAVDVVDTTGAGDAFVGALAAALDADASVEEAVRRGVRAGADAVRTTGAQPTS